MFVPFERSHPIWRHFCVADATQYMYWYNIVLLGRLSYFFSIEIINMLEFDTYLCIKTYTDNFNLKNSWMVTQ